MSQRIAPRLADRVRHAYEAGHANLVGDAPIDTMGRVYPEAFGSARAEALPRFESADVIDLGIGRYLPADPAIGKAVTAGVAAGHTHYLMLPETRQAVVSAYVATHGVHLDPVTELILVGGARAAMALTLLATLQPGDKVLIPDPDYVGLAHPVAGLGGEVVRVPMRRQPDGSFALDVERMVDAIENGCRFVMCTNPTNPVGLAWSHEAINAVSVALAKVGGLMIVNEVYDRLVFEPKRHVSALLAGDREHTVVVGGTGKVYDMTGLPLGWIAGPRWLVHALPDIMFLFHVPTPSSAALHAGVAALTEPVRDGHPAHVRAILKSNALATAKVFESFAPMRCPLPDGGQFLFPWVGGNDVELAIDLRRRFGVAVMPGSAWGSQGRGHLRVAIANDPDLQMRGLERLERGLGQIHGQRSIESNVPAFS